MADEAAVRVMFTCLGNICRSPMAEAVFADIVKKKGLTDLFHIESSGTAGYHVGEDPDPRTVQTCRGHNVPIQHSAQQLSRAHLASFDYVLVMDDSNLQNVQRLAGGRRETKAKVHLFGEFDPNGERIIADPYYGGINGFEHNFQQVTRCSEGFLKHLGY
ncbi:phosphotyrosine protein phosphatase I superfamily [Cladochytrium replicatum]|nr:phosphotyrosine protein phosphatase I superfamily [Cladochytrium replicatum]